MTISTTFNVSKSIGVLTLFKKNKSLGLIYLFLEHFNNIIMFKEFFYKTYTAIIISLITISIQAAKQHAYY